MEQKAQTLREYLDMIHVGPGDDSGFVVQELHKNTEMQVSRRYLECPTWEYMLNMPIFDYVYPYTNIYGYQTIKLILDDRKKNYEN